jgi:hypothetical protein
MMQVIFLPCPLHPRFTSRAQTRFLLVLAIGVSMLPLPAVHLVPTWPVQKGTISSPGPTRPTSAAAEVSANWGCPMLTRQRALSVMTCCRLRPLPHPPSPGVLLVSVCQSLSPRNKQDTVYVVLLMITGESAVFSLSDAMLATQPAMLLPVATLSNL